MPSNNTYPDSSTWLNDTRFLNYSGLQYLFYTKIKPMVENTMDSSSGPSKIEK